MNKLVIDVTYESYSLDDNDNIRHYGEYIQTERETDSSQEEMIREICQAGILLDNDDNSIMYISPRSILNVIVKKID